MNQEMPMESEGYLVVHVTTARGSIPVEGAAVSIRANEDAETAPNADILYATVTNRDGNTERITLSADDPMAENTLDNPTRIAPQSEWIPANGNSITTTLTGHSFTVLKINLQ